MKIAYNILLPVLHILCALLLAVCGFIRMLAWSYWSFGHTALYILIAAAVFSGHLLLLGWGRRRDLVAPQALRVMAAVDYAVFSLQLALVIAWLVWEFASPLLEQPLDAPGKLLSALLPVAAVDIAAMVIRQRSSHTVDDNQNTGSSKGSPL